MKPHDHRCIPPASPGDPGNSNISHTVSVLRRSAGCNLGCIVVAGVEAQRKRGWPRPALVSARPTHGRWALLVPVHHTSTIACLQTTVLLSLFLYCFQLVNGSYPLPEVMTTVQRSILWFNDRQATSRAACFEHSKWDGLRAINPVCT